jgi:hypothetical protein
VGGISCGLFSRQLVFIRDGQDQANAVSALPFSTESTSAPEFEALRGVPGSLPTKKVITR